MRIKQPISTTWKAILAVSLIAMLVMGYEYLSYRQHAANPDDTTIPSLVSLGKAFWQICLPQGSITKEIWLLEDAKATYGRLFGGLAIGCFLSVVVGVLMGCFEAVESFFFPTLNFLAKIPPTAMLAVFFVLVGTDETMFITMIAFGVMPTLTQAIYLSAKEDIYGEQIDKAYTLGGSNCEVIWNVVFRQILPKMIEAIRLQIGPAMVYLIAAEFMMGQVGFGYRLRIQQRLLHMDVVYDYVFILGITGYLMSQSMKRLRKWLCPWYEKLQ